jgi:hypothetical protein
MAELKNEKQFIEGVAIKEGSEDLGYGDREKIVTYESVMTRKAADARLVEIDEEIDILQQSLDKTNHTVEIDAPELSAV